MRVEESEMKGARNPAQYLVCSILRPLSLRPCSSVQIVIKTIVAFAGGIGVGIGMAIAFGYRIWEVPCLHVPSILDLLWFSIGRLHSHMQLIIFRMSFLTMVISLPN